MNPGLIMKLMSAKNTFTKNHPKVEAFVKKILLGGQLPEGTIIEMAVKKPGEETISMNFKVLQSDLELVEELKELTK
ncbi:MAG: hypothetical protein K6G30_10250 [Acetatifactor sp.]|nr:hypothetical protein [Acetatifactor sp.]